MDILEAINNPNVLPIHRRDKNATLPTRAHNEDAGLDLYSIEDTVIHPGQRALILTGVAIIIPKGHVGLICPRSGLAAKNGLTVLNAPGVIDSGYVGEIMVNLINHDGNPQVIQRGDRIAQLLTIPITTPTPVEVWKTPTTDRGEQGHGSSGK